MSRPDLARCEAAMTEVRQMLSMPSPECAAWSSITKHHRVYLLMATGLCSERQSDPWPAFSAEEKTKISDQVKAGGQLAKSWSRIRWHES